MEPEVAPIAPIVSPPKSRLPMIISLVVLVILLIGGGIYLYQKKHQEKKDNSTSQSTATATPKATGSSETPTPVATATPDTTNWSSYTSTTNNSSVSFRYPAEYQTNSTTTNSNTVITVSYPTEGLSRGIVIYSAPDSVSIASLKEPLDSNAGYTEQATKSIGGVSWYAYSYDRSKDPDATSQDPISVHYLVSHQGTTYRIIADLSATESLTKAQVQANLDGILATWKFTK